MNNFLVLTVWFFLPNSKKSSSSTKDVIVLERDLISKDFRKLKEKFKTLPIPKSLIPEMNGTPKRSIIIELGDRSGGIMLGDLIVNSAPHFFHNDPLITSKIPNAKMLMEILDCQYYSKQGRSYIAENTESDDEFFEHNTRLFKYCSSQFPGLCKSCRRISLFCKLFPFHVVRLSDFPMSQIEELLNMKM